MAPASAPIPPASGRRAVTLDDVARESGVSRATASRALNGRAGVRPEIRLRVERAAQTLAFVANRAARHLASGRASVIGLVIPSADLPREPYTASMTQAVGRAAARAGQGLVLHLAEEDHAGSLRQLVRDGLVDGLVVSTVAVGTPWVEELLDSALPIVLLGSRHPARVDIDAVEVENLESSAGAVEHLFAVGCRKVGTITGPQERLDSAHRVAGYRLAHERRGLPVDEALIVPGTFTRESGRRGAAMLAARGVDGIFAASDEMALGALWTLTRSGHAVPDDIAVAGFDGTSSPDVTEPTLTSVCQPFAEMGEAAVAVLLRRIDGAGPAAPTVLTPRLELGGSTRRRT